MFFFSFQRPIVSFSIENRKIINLKQKRAEKSRIKNPIFQNETNSKTIKGDNKKNMKSINKNMSKDSKGNDEESYSGLIAKPGVMKSRSKLKMKAQSQMHRENVNKLKQKRKKIKKLAEAKSIRNETDRMPQVSFFLIILFNIYTYISYIYYKFFSLYFQKNMKTDKEDAHFNKLVNNYKSRITSAIDSNKKWYDDS